MDAWTELESRLTAARVPRGLWPKYWEKEKYKKLRLRIKNDDEFRASMSRSLARDHSERRRQREFTQLLIVILWLLSDDHDDLKSWARSAWSTLLATAPCSRDGEYAQRLLAAITLAKCDGDIDQAESLLQAAGTNMVGQTFPLPTALRYIERAEVERRRTAQKPSPAPAARVSPTDPTETPQIEIKEADQIDDLSDEQMQLASPNF